MELHNMSPTKVTKVTLPDGSIVPVIHAKAAKMTPESERLRKSAEKAGANAAAKALAKGLSITIMKDGKLIRINPDKSEEVIGVQA